MSARPDLFYMVADLQRTAAEDAQLARWDLDDAHALEHRLLECLDDAHRSYLETRLTKMHRSACLSQARAARFYAQARQILGVES